MVQFLLDPAVLIFSTALALGLALTLLVALLAIMGGGFGDSDLDLDADIDTDLDADVDADIPESLITNALGWLDIGEVPKSILLIAFLFTFGIVGLTAQTILSNTTGLLVTPWIIAPLAIIPAVLSVRASAKAFKKLRLTGESSAVATDSLIGRTATITLGQTTFGRPTQAKVVDQHGRTHHVLVEPARNADQFDRTTPVVLVARKGSKFFVVAENTDDLDTIDFTALEQRG